MEKIFPSLGYVGTGTMLGTARFRSFQRIHEYRHRNRNRFFTSRSERDYLFVLIWKRSAGEDAPIPGTKNPAELKRALF